MCSYKQKVWNEIPELEINQIISQSADPTEIFKNCYTEECTTEGCEDLGSETTYMGWSDIPEGGLGHWLDDMDLVFDDLVTAGYRIHYSIEPHAEVAFDGGEACDHGVIYFEFQAGAQW